MTSPLRPRVILLALLALLAASCGASQTEPTTAEAPTPAAGEEQDAAGSDAVADEPTTEPQPTAEPIPTPEAAPSAEAPTTGVESLEGVALEFTTIATVVGQPLAVAAHPDGDSLLIAEKSGFVRQWLPQPDGTYESIDPPVVDLSDRTASGNEQGLLGLAVAPDGRHLYVAHSNDDGHNVLLEFGLDGSNERELLVVEQPFGNHNGGDLTFGPEGLLYYSLGDGGGSGDPLDTGQDRSDLLGSILRINPNPGGDTYAIPGDNPFVGEEGVRPEIWSFGLRNPWRFSFDDATGDLWIGDVGQDTIEEIDWLPAGGEVSGGAGANLGWSSFEGTLPFSSASAIDAVDPVFEYNHDNGCSVTGGYVARGNHPALEGAYLFSDYCERTVWGLVIDDAGNVVDRRSLGTVDANPVSFGRGHAGELLVLLASGDVQRITVS